MASEALTNAASPGAAAQSQAPAPETPAAPVEGAPAAAPPAPTKEEVDFSARFAALTKKERALLERERALKESQKSREADPEWAGYQEYKKLKENAKVNPLAYLQAGGLEFRQVAEFLANDKKLTPEQRVELLEETIRKDRDEKAKDAAKQQQEAVDRTIAQHKQAIGDFIQKDQDTYELLGTHGDDGVALVWQVIEDFFFDPDNQHLPPDKRTLPINVAAKHAEDWLEAQARDKILKTKKFQPKTQEVKAEAVADGTKTTHPAQPVSPTLTNRAVASAPPVESGKMLSEEESKRRAASMLRWT